MRFAEVRGGVDDPSHHAVRFVDEPVPHQSRRADRVVVRPHAPVVVADRVEAGHRRGQRADAPTREHRVGDEVPRRRSAPCRRRGCRSTGSGPCSTSSASSGRLSRSRPIANQPRSLEPEVAVEPFLERRAARAWSCAARARRRRLRSRSANARRAPRTRSPAPRTARSAASASRPSANRVRVVRVLPTLVLAARGRWCVGTRRSRRRRGRRSRRSTSSARSAAGSSASTSSRRLPHRCSSPSSITNNGVASTLP